MKSREKYDLAIGYFKVALTGENSERNAQIQFDIAQSYEKKGTEEKAIEEYLKVEYKYPRGEFWVTRSRLKCAGLMEKLGRNKKALAIYQKLAEGEGQEAKFAKEKIKLLKQYTK